MKLSDEQLVNLTIGQCISADNNSDDYDRKENIKSLERLIDSGKCNEIQLKLAKSGIEILKRELARV